MENPAYMYMCILCTFFRLMQEVTEQGKSFLKTISQMLLLELYRYEIFGKIHTVKHVKSYSWFSERASNIGLYLFIITFFCGSFFFPRCFAFVRICG